MNRKHVVIVGGGFAGMACADRLAKEKEIRITLIDKNNYQLFFPLLYQVATSVISADQIATPLRTIFEKTPNVSVQMAEVTSIDPHTMTVCTKDGTSYKSDYLVLATGSETNYFGVEGAKEHTHPLYSLEDSETLRSRLLAAFENANHDPHLIQEGVITFVVTGAGPTGVEIAGALADMINEALPKHFSKKVVQKAQVYLVDMLPKVLPSFSAQAHRYAASKLKAKKVLLRLGVAVTKVAADRVVLSDGTEIKTHTVIWAGGLQGTPLCSNGALPVGRGKRVTVTPDLRVQNFDRMYALGDCANIIGTDEKPLPQLAAVAKQCGIWAGDNIIRQIRGESTTPFQYKDRGVLAMIGRNCAVAELGARRHSIFGMPAFLAWLFIHVALLNTLRQKIQVLIDWAWRYCGKTTELHLLDRTEVCASDAATTGVPEKVVERKRKSSLKN